MNKLSVSLAALTILGATSAHAELMIQSEPDDINYLPKTGQELADLIRECTDDACMSYVSGVINGISVYTYLTERPSPICTGPDVRSNQIRDAIVGAIDDTPKLGRTAAPAAILTAFSRNWPCAATSAESVSNEIDAIDQPDDLITYADLPKADIDVLLDFISQNTSVLAIGNETAPLEKTLHVFDDPNCEYCEVLTDELDTLVADGWRILIYPVSNVSEESKGYAAVQIAVREANPTAAEALYRFRSEDVKDITTAMQVAQDAGMTMPEILNMLAASNPYQTLDINNAAFENLGADDTPSWILGDRVASGITDASEIIRLQKTMISELPEKVTESEEPEKTGSDNPEEDPLPIRPGVDQVESQ